MKITLIRDISTEKSTVGRLFAGGEFICFTLENAWKDNLKRVSCIPKGTYGLSTKKYGRYWKKYQIPIPILSDVPNRSEILIHPGNYPKDTLGCILVGSSKGEDFVGNSVKTWKKILPILEEATEITIE